MTECNTPEQCCGVHVWEVHSSQERNNTTRPQSGLLLVHLRSWNKGCTQYLHTWVNDHATTFALNHGVLSSKIHNAS